MGSQPRWLRVGLTRLVVACLACLCVWLAWVAPMGAAGPEPLGPEPLARSLADSGTSHISDGEIGEWDNETNSTNGTTTTELDAAGAVGADRNGEESVAAAKYSLMLYGILLVAYLSVFSAVRRLLPVMYSFFTTPMAGNQRLPSSFDLPDTLLGWVPTAATIAYKEDLWKHIGLDQAMLLELPELILKICLSIAVPLVLVMCPLHRWVGTEDERRRTDCDPRQDVSRCTPLDNLSMYGTHNLRDQDVLFWAHGVLVWLVVIVSCHFIREAEEKFVKRRFDWLHALPEPRAKTLMVEGIPDEYQSDEQLQSFFEQSFSKEAVASAHVVKKADRLRGLVAEAKNIKSKMRSVKFQQADSGEVDTEVIEHTKSGTAHDAATYLPLKLQEVEEEIEEERDSIRAEAKKTGGVNTSSGFVTFTTQREAAAALSAQLTMYEDEFFLSHPPGPDDVMYQHLGTDKRQSLAKAVLGYFLIFVIFWGLVLAISTMLWCKDWVKTNLPNGFLWVASLLEGVAAPVIFQQCLAFLPTIFRTIFNSLFVIQSEPYMQSILYKWYFWFLYVFVLLFSIIGDNAVEFGADLSKHPFDTPSILAEQLPNFTNFYISLVILQTSNHGLNMIRHVNVLKYLGSRGIYSKKDAKRFAEPEDQDYYGIGSRSARWMNTALIGLVFCQIQPLLLIVVIVHNVVCKFVYGYLVVFAETRKSDIGGLTFMRQITHLQIGLLTYILLMTGYLSTRGPNIPFKLLDYDLSFSPSMMSWMSAIYLFYKSRRISNVRWRNLPWAQIPDKAAVKNQISAKCYIQPELLAEMDDDQWMDDGRWDESDSEGDEDTSEGSE